MTLSPMHLVVVARRISTTAQGRVTAVSWASQVPDTASTVHAPRRGASPQRRAPHANICEAGLCRQPFHMPLLQLPPLTCPPRLTRQ